MDGWLLGQVSTVLTALSHAQELFDGAGRPTLPQEFAPRARPSGQSRRRAAVTQPSVETAQSGEAADAVRTLQAELSSDYSEMRSAEIQLTEAILTAHAVTVSGRARLQDIQRQLIEAINNPLRRLIPRQASANS